MCFLLLSGFLLSCNKDFLEKPLSSDVTIDTIFSTKVKAESFLWETYRTSVPQGFPHDWGADGRENHHDGMYASMLMAASDEGDVYDSWPSSNVHNVGSWSPNYNAEDQFGYHYKGIRNASLFIENIGRVSDISETEKQQMRAEAVVLRALQYSELLKRYGGIPLVLHSLKATGNVKIPRSSFQECVDFIVKSCDSAAAVLPQTYPKASRGRITSGTALAVKARTLLYAASPLHNGTPYLDDQKKLTGYGNFDVQRWQLAADANKAVLDWAADNGVELVKTHADPAMNYEAAIAQTDNSEIILANKGEGSWGDWWPMTGQFLMPRGFYGGWYGHGVTLQHAQKYQTTAGVDQVWDTQGSFAEFVQKMQEMEPRFQQSVFYSGGKWNDELGVREFFKRSNGSWTGGAPVNGVGFMKKFLTRDRWGDTYQQWIVFRLAEFYLNYAEALNEVTPMAAESYSALNKIRERAGVPLILPADPRYNSQEKLRAAIRRERAVELAFEEHRFFDVRRWKIAGEEGVMKGQMWGLNVYEQADGSKIYKKEPFENRVWEDKMYLYPIPQSEIDKGYVIQTPGWL